MIYIFAPFIGWLTAGILKFLINFIRFGSEARQRIGNGGFPSTHTSTITTTVFLIGLKEGFDTPVFSLGVAVAFIIIIDATGLRRHVGYQAARLNELMADSNKKLRESMGHSLFEILGGIVVGCIVASLLNILF